MHQRPPTRTAVYAVLRGCRISNESGKNTIHDNNGRLPCKIGEAVQHAVGDFGKVGRGNARRDELENNYINGTANDTKIEIGHGKAPTRKQSESDFFFTSNPGTVHNDNRARSESEKGMCLQACTQQ